MVRKRQGILFFFQRNCICIAAVLAALLLYSKTVPVRDREPYSSLIPPRQVRALDCQVVSNPVKTGSGRFYRCTVRVRQVAGQVAGNNPTQGASSRGDPSHLAQAQASGRAVVYIPAPFVEAFYPGKLYSRVSSRSADSSLGLVEEGAFLRLSLGESFSPARNGSPRDSGPAPDSSAGGEPVFYAVGCAVLGYADGWWGRVQEFRGLCRLQFKRLMYGWGDAGGLLLALLSGSGEYTDKEVGDDFRTAGLAHVLALSGMHLSFFAALASVVFRRVGRAFALAFSLVAVLLFVWFAGMSPSLLRSLIGCLLGMAAGLWGMKVPMTRILALCFFIHIMVAPQDLGRLSFQLSYLALAGILVAGPLLDPLTHRLFPPATASSVSASVGAQVFSAPVTLLTLGTMMPGGVIASVVVSPLVSAFMTVGIVSVIASLLWAPLGEPLGHLVNLLYTLVVVPVKLFARIPVLELP